MLNRRIARSDEGMTLIELLIAMVIMGIAIIVLVGAMATVVTATSQHRGHSVEETAARNYAEAIQQKIDFRTKLAADVTNNANQITVQDGNGFQHPTLTDDFYIVVDQETMVVTSRSGNTLTVSRGEGGAQAAHQAVKHIDGHDVDTLVAPLLVCPEETANGADGNLTPSPAAAAVPTDVTASVKANSVQYWDPVDKSFTWTHTDCVNHFEDVCLGGEIRPECELGFYRLTVVVAPTAGWNDNRFKSVTTETQVLVRRGSA
jgi:prepilin-type N-terminal cleavage/methylation domain-containing protein